MEGGILTNASSLLYYSNDGVNDLLIDEFITAALCLTKYVLMITPPVLPREWVISGPADSEPSHHVTRSVSQASDTDIVLIESVLALVTLHLLNQKLFGLLLSNTAKYPNKRVKILIKSCYHVWTEKYNIFKIYNRSIYHKVMI